MEAAKRYAAVGEREADGTPVLRLRAPNPAASTQAMYEIIDVTTGIAGVGLLDACQETAAGVRYQHVEAGDAQVALLARASDSLPRSGAGDDAMMMHHGDNVLDAGAGSNWLVGGAGNDGVLVEANAGGEVWNTVVNFHVGDVLTMRGIQGGVSSRGWMAAAEGAAGCQGATLRGARNGRDVDFSLTLAGISVEQAREFDIRKAGNVLTRRRQATGRAACPSGRDLKRYATKTRSAG